MTKLEATILDRLTFKWQPLKATGASASSGYSTVIRRMVAKGWVAREQRGETPLRAAWLYRITGKGSAALANHAALTRLRAGLRAAWLADHGPENDAPNDQA